MQTSIGMSQVSISYPLDIEPEGLRVTETHVFTEANTAFGLHRVSEVKDH
jgi:hypothetical protein